jgi:hypothetical protein
MPLPGLAQSAAGAIASGKENLMAQKQSVWTRIQHFLAPPRESYDTRRARPNSAAGEPGAPVYEATDRRRHGGSMEIGSL